MGFVDIVIWYRLFAYSLADATAIPKPHHFCLIKIHNGLTFLALAYQGCPGKKRPLKWKMVIIYICSVLQPWELMVCIVTMYCSAKHSIDDVSIYPYPSGYVYPPISLSVRGVVIVNKYSCYATAIGSHCDTPVLATAMLV